MGVMKTSMGVFVLFWPHARSQSPALRICTAIPHGVKGNNRRTAHSKNSAPTRVGAPTGFDNRSNAVLERSNATGRSSQFLSNSKPSGADGLGPALQCSSPAVEVPSDPVTGGVKVRSTELRRRAQSPAGKFPER